MADSQLINSFNAGELSPFVSSRVELDKYHSGCQRLENFIILPYGGVVRRPGTEFLGKAKREDGRARLIGFKFSTTTSFVLELGEVSESGGYIRFWSGGTGEPVKAPGTQAILEVETPYRAIDLRDVQYLQINDIMYFVHRDYPPYKLSRLADDDWTFAKVDWTWPPFLDENVKETTITLTSETYEEWSTTHGDYAMDDVVMHDGRLYRSTDNHGSGSPFAESLEDGHWVLISAPAEGESVPLIASDDIFDEYHVGAYWMIAHRREDAYLDLKMSESGTSDPLDVLGKWELTSYGTWKGTIKVQRSTDGGDLWETIRTYHSSQANERNVSSTGDEDKQCLLRIDYEDLGGSSAEPHVVLEVGDNRRYGIVRITGVTNKRHATGEVVKDLGGIGATKIWAEGAFSRRQGYPRAVCLHDQRVVFGGTFKHPMSVWGSVTDDFENFRTTANDDGSFFFTLSGTEANPIQWLMSQGSILIGTAGNEWTLGPTDSAQGLSPTNVQAKYQSNFGSMAMQARAVNEVILFTQRNGRKVRELTYSFEKDGWVAPDLTILAEHISEGGFVEAAFQQQPDSIYWAITGAGQLVGMTYERDQQVVGWHRHTTQGEFESVATIYSLDGKTDEVWFVVRRVIDGRTVRFVERMRVDFRTAFDHGDKASWWYADCGFRLSSTEATTSLTVENLNVLNGAEVTVLANGAPQAEVTVSNGRVELASPASSAVVGLAYTSILSPMPLDLTLQDGTSQGRKGRVHKIFARFHKSLGGEYSADGETWHDIFARDFADAMDAGPPVFTGEKEVYMGGGFTSRPEVLIRQAQPLPLCVLAIIPRWETYGE